MRKNTRSKQRPARSKQRPAESKTEAAARGEQDRRSGRLRTRPKERPAENTIEGAARGEQDRRSGRLRTRPKERPAENKTEGAARGEHDRRSSQRRTRPKERGAENTTERAAGGEHDRRSGELVSSDLSLPHGAPSQRARRVHGGPTSPPLQSEGEKERRQRERRSAEKQRTRARACRRRFAATVGHRRRPQDHETTGRGAITCDATAAPISKKRRRARVRARVWRSPRSAKGAGRALASDERKGDYAILWGLFHYFIDRNLRNLRIQSSFLFVVDLPHCGRGRFC